MCKTTCSDSVKQLSKYGARMIAFLWSLTSDKQAKRHLREFAPGIYIKQYFQTLTNSQLFCVRWDMIIRFVYTCVIVDENWINFLFIIRWWKSRSPEFQRWFPISTSQFHNTIHVLCNVKWVLIVWRQFIR
jgi:hypothetical protein